MTMQVKSGKFWSDHLSRLKTQIYLTENNTKDVWRNVSQKLLLSAHSL